jgi:hypothetical protein
MKSNIVVLGSFFLLLFRLTVSAASGPAVAWPGGIMGDYSCPPREATVRPDGYHHVDTPALIERLKYAHITTYMFLFWNNVSRAPITDWDDFRSEFMPAAQAAGLDVWAYIVPPSEGGPTFPFDASNSYSPETGYLAWAKAIAGVAVEYGRLKGFVMDDFFTGSPVQAPFTPAFVAQMMQEAHAISPSLGFQIIAYQTTPWFAHDYAAYLDGVILPFCNLDDTASLPGLIRSAKNDLRGRAESGAYELYYPRDMASKAGDFAGIACTVAVGPASYYGIRFCQDDDYTGATAGYHFKRFLVDGNVAWSQDVAGAASPETVSIDLTSRLSGKTSVALMFELYDTVGVSNFKVDFRFKDVVAVNFSVEDPSKSDSTWTYSSNNTHFTGEIGFKIDPLPLTVMVYAYPTSWHTDPPTTQYISDALTIAHRAILSGDADGLMTYCLNKNDTVNADFRMVKTLYTAWGEGQTGTGCVAVSRSESMGLALSPNPFNPASTVQIRLRDVSGKGAMTLRVFSVEGRCVADLTGGLKASGQIQWRPGNLAAGIYIAKYSTGTKTWQSQAMLIK